MVDYLTSIWNFQIMGIQITPLIIFIAVCYGAYLLIKRLWKTKEPKFEKKEIKKEFKKENNELFSSLSIKANKTLRLGYNTIGFVMEYVTFKEKPRLALIKGKLKLVEDKTAIKKDILGLKVRNNNILWWLLSKLGIGIKYYFIDKDLTTDSDNEIIINQNAEFTIFNGVTIFSNQAREVVENIAFKINREAELEELINYIPKMNYLETTTSQIVARLREKAEIEKEKYRGQVDSAGD